MLANSTSWFKQDQGILISSFGDKLEKLLRMTITNLMIVYWFASFMQKKMSCPRAHMAKALLILILTTRILKCAACMPLISIITIVVERFVLLKPSYNLYNCFYWIAIILSEVSCISCP